MNNTRNNNILIVKLSKNTNHIYVSEKLSFAEKNHRKVEYDGNAVTRDMTVFVINAQRDHTRRRVYFVS